MARSQLQRLKFNGTLSGAAGEVSKQLKALHEELSGHDQDLIDSSSLDKVAKQCMQPRLLLHKDLGVKAYLAACLADLLRLYAPEAPYNQAELKDLFQFLFRQLGRLANQSDPHFSTYFYTAESLANVKSIVLVADLDASEELMLELFKQAFDTVSSSSPKNVTLCLADLLVQLIDEVATVSTEVVDTLLEQFLPRAAKVRPAALRLAIDVGTGSSDKLQRGVFQYFVEVLNPEQTELSESEFDEVKTAHSLVVQLAKSVPGLLLSVIPLLSQSLLDGRPSIRALTTSTLGDMFGDKIGSNDLASQYSSAWKDWLGRVRDKDPAVRAQLARKLGPVWNEHSQLSNDIEQTTRQLIRDSDDRVRLAGTAVYAQLDYDTVANYANIGSLQDLAERCKDRKPPVRAQAFATLGQLYELAYPDIEAKDDKAIAHFGWIPSKIIGSVIFGDHQTQTSLRAAVRDTIQSKILPLPAKDDDEAGWVERWLTIFSQLDESDKSGLLALTKLTVPRPSAFDAFVNACEANNGGTIDGDEQKIKSFLKMTIKALSDRQPEPEQVAKDLYKFAAANEKQLYKLMRTMADPQSELKTILKAHKEINKRVEKIAPTLVESVSLVLRESCYLLVNRSSISPLLKSAQAGSGDSIGASALATLDFIARKRPILFKSHVAELTKALSDSRSSELVTLALHALSKLAKADSSFQPDKTLSHRALKLAKSDQPRQAKYAATIIGFDESRKGTADDLVDFLADKLDNARGSELVPRLGALARLARHAPDVFERRSADVTRAALEVLNRAPEKDEQLHEDDEGASWAVDDDPATTDLVLARQLALKLLANRALAYADSDEAEKTARPVFDTLWPLILAGEGVEARFTRTTASRVRLSAVLAVLKLATKDAFSQEILSHFAVLSKVVQDPTFEVRAPMTERLIHYLQERRITKLPRLHLLLFLTAHEPDDDVRAEVVRFVRRKVSSVSTLVRQVEWEHPFVRLIHLVAHHDDYERIEDEQTLFDVAKYFDLFLACVATKENLSYLYHLALKLKTVRDNQAASFDENLYKLAELAQHLILELGTQRSWPVSTHPQPVKMPGDIFRSLATPRDAQSISDRVYLDAALLQALDARRKEAHVGPGKPARPPRVRGSPKPRKRSVSAAGGPKKAKSERKKRRKLSAWDKEDDYGSSTDDDEGDDDDESEADSDASGANASAKKSSAPRPGARAGLRSNPVDDDEDGDGMEVDDEEPATDEAEAESEVTAKQATRATRATRTNGN